MEAGAGKDAAATDGFSGGQRDAGPCALQSPHLQDLALHSAHDDGDDSSNHGSVTANTHST